MFRLCYVTVATKTNVDRDLSYPHFAEERMRFRTLKSHSYKTSLDSLNHYATCAPTHDHEQYVTYILITENHIAFKK